MSVRVSNYQMQHAEPTPDLFYLLHLSWNNELAVKLLVIYCLFTFEPQKIGGGVYTVKENFILKLRLFDLKYLSLRLLGIQVFLHCGIALLFNLRIWALTILYTIDHWSCFQLTEYRNSICVLVTHFYFILHFSIDLEGNLYFLQPWQFRLFLPLFKSSQLHGSHSSSSSLSMVWDRYPTTSLL